MKYDFSNIFRLESYGLYEVFSSQTSLNSIVLSPLCSLHIRSELSVRSSRASVLPRVSVAVELSLGARCALETSNSSQRCESVCRRTKRPLLGRGGAAAWCRVVDGLLENS